MPRGKKPNQRMKHYLVYEYLRRETDENHTSSANTIAEYLSGEYGISAERRSIYKDIEELNAILYMLDNNISFSDALDDLAEDDTDELKSIVYNKTKKGFYLKRKYELDDIKLLVECVYSSRFLTEHQSELLSDIVLDLVSEHQKDSLMHDVLLTDRVRTSNKEVLANIGTINEAMSKEIQGAPHIPEKISFQYLKHDIENLEKQVTRRKGDLYVISPYKLLINDGNYYLLGFDDKSKKMRTYRIDRMKKVKNIGEPREGEDAFLAVDLKSYTKRVFNMFGGKERQITLRCVISLLDTMVDRFGTKDATYKKLDDNHFAVTAQMEVSDQFFGWVCSFGKRIKIVSPVDVKQNFGEYVSKIRDIYKDVIT